MAQEHKQPRRSGETEEQVEAAPETDVAERKEALDNSVRLGGSQQYTVTISFNGRSIISELSRILSHKVGKKLRWLG